MGVQTLARRTKVAEAARQLRHLELRRPGNVTERAPRPLRRGIWRAWLRLRHQVIGRRYRRLVLERVDGVPLVIFPNVFNPVLLRTGVFLARNLPVPVTANAPDSTRPRALDVGTGSGIGAIFAAVIPDPLRSRVTGAFQAANYGTRPLGALLGGLLGASFGLRPALWAATLGGAAAFSLLLPTPLPRFRMPRG